MAAQEDSARLTGEDISTLLVAISCFGKDVLDRDSMHNLLRLLGLRSDNVTIDDQNQLDKVIEITAHQINGATRTENDYHAGICNMISSNNILNKDSMAQALSLMAIDLPSEKMESLIYYLARNEWDPRDKSVVSMIDEESIQRFIRRYEQKK